MSFKDVIYNLRTSRNMSQIEFARAIGSSQAAITAWENGKQEPGLNTRRAIAEAFHVPIEELIESVQPDDDEMRIARAIKARDGLRVLFDRANKLSDRDIRAVNAVVAAIVRENSDE